MNDYIDQLKMLNNKALQNDDVPVSAIIFCNDKIISKGYNMREKYNNPLLHAEVVAVQKAARKLKTWNLSDCDIICTLKPCKMCTEILRSAKIKRIYYIVDNTKDINNVIELTKIKCNQEDYFVNELKNFFADKR